MNHGEKTEDRSEISFLLLLLFFPGIKIG
jgi:hypothetical protein